MTGIQDIKGGIPISPYMSLKAFRQPVPRPSILNELAIFLTRPIQNSGLPTNSTTLFVTIILSLKAIKDFSTKESALENNT
jgi:hypothetical protein